MNDAHHGMVLIIEDDPGVARLQQRRLERAGYSVACAATVEEGIQKVGGVDLVLLDYRLADGCTGLDVYGQLRAAGFDVPVIMVTGFSDEATVIQALRVGVRDFVTKSAEYLDYLPCAVQRVLKQVRIEQRLAQSEARLAGIIRSATDAIMTVDSEQKITLFNAAAERVFRCSSAEALGRDLKDFIPSRTEGTISTFQKTGREGHLCGNWFEMQGVRADGDTFPLETSVSTAELIGEKLYIVIVRDITERKQAQQRLREQAMLIDQATNAIVVYDLDGAIRFWNQGAARLFGFAATEVAGKKVSEVLFKGPSAAFQEARGLVRKLGEWHGELNHTTKAGKDVIVESRLTLTRDEKGQPHTILAISTDITDKKKIEAQLLRTQRMEGIGTLAGGIAHDLNNLLTPILMATELLKLRTTDPVGRSFLATMQSSAERGADMVKQVLAFARGADGQRAPVQLRHIVHDVEKMLKHTLPKSIEVETSFAPNLWSITGDATQLHQVLMNLSINGRDAMPHGGRLTIRAENCILDESYARMNPQARPGPFVLVTVTDTGTGMSAEVLEKAFDPFFTTKEHGKGTGLGLSTVAGIVKSHCGFVSIQSEVGEGSTFSVHFPANETAQSREAEESNGHLPVGNGELVLVADDEISIREITKATLEMHGYRALLASDGAEAIAVYAQHKGNIQAVIVDMMMPVMDGPATIRALHKIDPQVRIIAVSGLTASGKAPQTIESGVFRFLAKPHTAERLLTTLREIMSATLLETTIPTEKAEHAIVSIEAGSAR